MIPTEHNAKYLLEKELAFVIKKTKKIKIVKTRKVYAHSLAAYSPNVDRV